MYNKFSEARYRSAREVLASGEAVGGVYMYLQVSLLNLDARHVVWVADFGLAAVLVQLLQQLLLKLLQRRLQRHRDLLQVTRQRLAGLGPLQ